MPTLQEISGDPKFQSLSPDAKKIVFERVTKDDTKFNALSQEAKRVVESRIMVGKESTGNASYALNQFKKGILDTAALPQNLADIARNSRILKSRFPLSEDAKNSNDKLNADITGAASKALGTDPNMQPPRDQYGRESLLSKIVGNSSEMLGAMVVPGGNAVRMAKDGTRVAQAAKEALNAIVSGEGMTMGQEFTKGTGHQQLGGFAGSLFGPGAVSLGLKIGKGVGKVASAGYGAIKDPLNTKFTDADWAASQAKTTGFGEYAKQKAAKDVANRVGGQMNSSVVSKNVENSQRLGNIVPNLAQNLNLAQATGSPYLVSQAQHYASKSPQVLERATEQKAGATKAIDDYFSKKFPGFGSPTSGAIKDYNSRIENLDKGIKALDNKERQIGLSLARGDQEAFGNQARDIISERMSLARQKKNDLFARVDEIAKQKGMMVDVTDIRDMSKGIIQDRGRSFQDDPTILGKIYRTFVAPTKSNVVKTTPTGNAIKLRGESVNGNKIVPFDEFMSLYRQANSDARNLEMASRSGGEAAIVAGQKLHSVNQIRELLQTKIAKFEGSDYGDVAKALKEANSFYGNEYQNLFRKGVGGEILKAGRFSPHHTENADIFRKLIFKPRDSSGVTEFMDAAGNSPEAKNLVHNSVMDLFAKEVVKTAPDGGMVISQQQINEFLKRYKEPLGQIPGVLSEISTVKGAMESLRRNADAITKTRQQLSQSAVAKIAGSENPEFAIVRAMKSPSSMEALLSTATPQSRRGIEQYIAKNALKQKDPMAYIKENSATLRKALGLQRYQDLRVLAEARVVIARTDVPQYLSHEPLKDVLDPIGTTLKQGVSDLKAIGQGRVSKAYVIAGAGARFMDKLRGNEADIMMAQAIYDPDFGTAVAKFLRSGSETDKKSLMRRMARYGYESAMSPTTISHMTRAISVGASPRNEQ